jgi:hypothetical protein
MTNADTGSRSLIRFLQRTSSLPIFLVCFIGSHSSSRLLIIQGLTDTNAHRVRATRSYLRKCDFIIVAHTNTRAGDDPGFKKNVRTCHRLKRNGNVAVVITQSDVRSTLATISMATDSSAENREHEECSYSISAGRDSTT